MYGINTDSSVIYGSKFTCSHGLAELDQTLKGEIGDMRRAPFACGTVKVLLVAHPAARLLPNVFLELIQLHIGLWE